MTDPDATSHPTAGPPPPPGPAFVAVWLLLASLPVAFAVWFVAGFSMVTPLFDQWQLLSFYARVSSGEARFGELFAPHNGLHVIAFARVFLLALARLTDWSFRAETWVSFTLSLLAAWALHRIARGSSSRDAGDLAPWVASFFTVCLLFSPASHVIWTWSVGFFHFLENACIAGAIWALVRPEPAFRTAIVLCTIATFNRFEGVLGWLVLFPLALEATRFAPTRRRMRTAWILLAATCAGVCLGAILLSTPEAMTPPPSDSVPLTARLLLVASLVGSSPASFAGSWIPGATPANAFWPAGALIIAAFAALAVRLASSAATRARALPWISLGGFGLAFAAAVGIGRAGIGTGAPASAAERAVATWYLSAYSATASLVTIATVHLLAMVLGRGSHSLGAARRPLGWVLGAAGLAAVLGSYAHAMPDLLAQRRDGRADRYCVELAPYMDDRNTCVMRADIVALLEKAHLREIRHDVTFEPAMQPIGRIEGTDYLAEGGTTAVSGWVALPGESAGTVLLEVRGRRRFLAPATRLEPRNGGLAWRVSLPRPMVRAHTDVVRAWAYDRARRRFLPLDGEARL